MHRIPSRARFLAAGAAALASPAIVQAPAKAAQFSWKAVSSQPVDHPITVRATQLWKSVKDESNGRLEVQFFPNSQLGGDPAMLSQLRLGAVQFQVISPPNLSPVVPPVDIVTTGFALRDVDDGIRALAGPLGEYLRKESLTKGIYVVDEAWDIGMLHITSGTHPIRDPDDLRGFKIRIAQSRITVDLFKAFDANPVGISLSELYTAMQTHVIDGGAQSLGIVQSAKYFEVQNFMSLTGQGWAGGWIIANAAAWNSLPSDIQDIVVRNARRLGTIERREVKYLNLALIDKLSREGMKFNAPDQAPFRARLGNYYKTWANEFGSSLWGMFEDGLGRRLA